MTGSCFRGPFAKSLEAFVDHKRAVGYSYDSVIVTLRQFDTFCLKHHREERVLSKQLVNHWVTQNTGESTGTQRIRATAIRQFALFLDKLNCAAYVFPGWSLPSYRRYSPYIFTDKEITAFFAQVDSCSYSTGYPLRHLRLPVLFRLLYCCGLRVSEATSLACRDVDLSEGLLVIRNTKFGKDRRVPMSPQMCERCREYSRKVHSFSEPDSFFFSASMGTRPLSATTVYGNFREFLWDAGISHGGKGKGPRLHDLRHTFAVHSLRRWAITGVDLSAYLPVMRTYLGHSHFRQTAYYLRLTADLFPNITMKVERIFAHVIPEIGVANETN